MKGRIAHIRHHGGVCFIDVAVDGVLTQLKLQKSETKDYVETVKSLFIGACVKLELEESKVKSLQIQSFPYRFPKEYPSSTIGDEETLIKNRTLVYTTDSSKYQKLISRLSIIRSLRKFFDQKAIHVDLNVLEERYGGAYAKPFSTRCNYNKKDYFLRISLEFPLKRLIISGLPNVYSIGPCFRNEGLDRTHTFQYLHMQYYTTDKTPQDVRALVEELYHLCYYEVHGIHTKHGFDLRDPWPVYRKGVDDHKVNSGDLGPFYHLIGFEYTPLAKGDYFESYVDYDMQLTTGYDEQNDSSKIGIDEAVDPTFVEDLAYGMVNTVGLGLGVDRFVSSILGAGSLRETQVFPHY